MKNKAFDNTSRILLNKTCPLSGKDAPKIDYKNINLLKRYTTEKGKNSSKQSYASFYKKTKTIITGCQKSKVSCAYTLRIKLMHNSDRENLISILYGSLLIVSLELFFLKLVPKIYPIINTIPLLFLSQIVNLRLFLFSLILSFIFFSFPIFYRYI